MIVFDPLSWPEIFQNYIIFIDVGTVNETRSLHSKDECQSGDLAGRVKILMANLDCVDAPVLLKLF